MRKKVTTVVQNVPSARIQDLTGELTTATRRFRELVYLSRTNEFILLASELDNPFGDTPEVVQLDSSLRNGLRKIFEDEANNIAKDVKKRFNITLDPADV